MEPLPPPPKILPPHYFAISVVLLVVLGYGMPGALLPPPYPWLGLLPMGVGVFIAVRGSQQFRSADTNIIPLTRSSALVEEGVFAISRNPMYLGMLLFLGGGACLANSLWAWAIPVLFFLLIRQRFVLKEEALMLATFGESYAGYCRRVRRWF